MERDSNRHRPSDRSSGSRRRNEREEREEKERRDRRDREERQRRDRERSEKPKREREKSDRERKDRDKRERSERDTQQPRETGRHERDRSDREKQRKREQEKEEKKRREKRDSDRHKRERETYGRESPKRKQETKERHGGEEPQDWSARMDEFAHRLQQHQRQTIRPQTQTHSGSGASSTYIPPRPQQQFEQWYSESTYDTRGGRPTIIDIPRFPPPMLPPMTPPMHQPMHQQMFPPYAYPGYAPQYQLPQQSGETVPYFSPSPMFGIPPQQQTELSSRAPTTYPPIQQSHGYPTDTSRQSSTQMHKPLSKFTDELSNTPILLTVISREQNWYNERYCPPNPLANVTDVSVLIGKACFIRTINKERFNNTIFVMIGGKRHCVEPNIDSVKWYLYITNILQADRELKKYGTYKFQEHGMHLVVNYSNHHLLSTYMLEDKSQPSGKKISNVIHINSVIPFCRNGSVCYGMQIVDNQRQGLRHWWFKLETDTLNGFYEMYDSDPYQTRVRLFRATQGMHSIGILLHSDAKLIAIDKGRTKVTEKKKMISCYTLYCGGSFIMFDNRFGIYIESEQKLVTFQDLFNCGAIADITVRPNALLMLGEFQSKSGSAVWGMNVGFVEGNPNFRDAHRVVLRIPDRNSISCMWYWNSDFNSGLQYVQWYQSTRNWSTKFEFESHPFTPPFAGTPKPEMEPKKLWLGTDPKNWLLERNVFE